jgi:hypothetical protein
MTLDGVDAYERMIQKLSGHSIAATTTHQRAKHLGNGRMTRNGRSWLRSVSAEEMPARTVDTEMTWFGIIEYLLTSLSRFVIRSSSHTRKSQRSLQSVLFCVPTVMQDDTER